MRTRSRFSTFHAVEFSKTALPGRLRKKASDSQRPLESSEMVVSDRPKRLSVLVDCRTLVRGRVGSPGIVATEVVLSSHSDEGSLGEKPHETALSDLHKGALQVRTRDVELGRDVAVDSDAALGD